MLLSRRRFLYSSLAAAEPVKRSVFLRSPGKGTAVMAYAYYTRPHGGEMMSIEQRWSRSDTIDRFYYRFSKDNGRTWNEPLERPGGEKRPDGMLRRHPRGGWVDPHTGRFIELWLEGTLPTDDPLEGLRQWKIFYTVSGNGYDPRAPVHQVIHRGAEFDSRHWLPGVFAGKNCAMLGDHTSQPVAMKDGRILLPVEISPIAPDGSLYNPGGGYTYHETAVLHGRWKGRALEWEMSDLVSGDPRRSTRGMSEPGLAEIGGGRLMMTLRGSNDRKPELPGYRWVTYSDDGGWKWSAPVPWTYANGDPFYSPSSCSQLLRHSSGRTFWLGNITPANPRGNRPRYPFYVGEVDARAGLLKRESLREVDGLRPGENDQLTLSNFYAREDRETREICLHMTRLFALPDGWEGDAMIYRIPV
jgi:hypothetical protein